MNDSAQLQSRVRRLEAVQAMLLDVGRLSCTSRDLDGFLAAIHAAVAKILYAANFFVALYDPADSTIRFAYFVDEIDPPEDPAQRYPLRRASESATAWVILEGKPLVLTAEDFIGGRFSGAEAEWQVGTDPAHWIGMPLRTHDGRVLGALVIQSYRTDLMYSGEDITLFEQIADNISITLELLTATQRLERAIEERTRQLGQEVIERRRSEELQRGLYEIAALSATDATLDEVYRTVHIVTSRLMYAKNFFIMLYHEEERSGSFPYIADEFDDEQSDERVPLWRGATAYVVRTRQPQFIDKQRLAELARAGEIQESRGSTDISTWMGAPMIVGERLYGVIVAQSYDPAIRHTRADLGLLAYMATHVASALSRRDAAEQLARHNAELTLALAQLRDTQGELVRQEKLASLGSLVAGIAHEINTPLGICMTATTHVQDEMKNWRGWNEAGTFDATKIDVMLDDLGVVMHILDNNIRRGAELVRSFKQIATDQSSGQRRLFDLAEYLDEIVLSLRPRFKHTPYAVAVACPRGIVMDSYPGALSQVVTNLVMNCLLHAFDGRDRGEISIRAQAEDADVALEVSDDGAGMNTEDLKRYFDPFFTTRRGSGGTGLGAHIVFNQVTSVLGGTIRVDSAPGKGTSVRMRLPRSHGPA